MEAKQTEWQHLLDALRRVHHVNPGALPPAAVVAADQPTQWDSDTATRVYRLLTQQPHLLDGTGIDPASLPQPRQVLNLTKLDDSTVALTSDTELPHTVTDITSTIPDTITTPTSARIPVDTDTIPPLRQLVALHDVTIASDALQLLRDPPSPRPTVTLSSRGAVETRTGRHPEFERAVQSVPGTTRKAGTTTPVLVTPNKSLHHVARLAEQYGVTVAPEIEEAARKRSEPFEYDGSLEGLRGVPLTELETVPSRVVDGFAQMGLTNVFDLLMHVPLRYLDRSRLTPIAQLLPGEEAAILGRVTKINTDRNRRLVRFQISDHSGAVSVTFFNALWQAKRFAIGDEVVLLGQMEIWNGKTQQTKQMTNPLMDPVGDDTLPIIPVYPQSAKSRITTWDIVTAAREAIARLGTLEDPLPADIVQAENLLPRQDAYRSVHFPQDIQEVAPARHRLAFDELFRLQAALQMSKMGHASLPGVSMNPEGDRLEQFRAALPFPLTSAQKRAWSEISHNMQSHEPMNRLLQGDVGSGKTMLAIMSLLTAVQSGYQGALMAPTEILATQLFTELRTRLTAGGGDAIRIELLTNKVRGKKREQLLNDLKNGDVDIAVGTHALLVDDVEFHNLGLVVVDEQHRFGVEQRATLRDKTTNGVTPDMLVMTATPIPRTAAMTVFGDLDVSVIDELPPGRTPIATAWLDVEPNLDGLALPPWDLVRSEVGKGRQAYVVCPLVTESEKLQAADATQTFESLAAGALHGLRLGLVHGQQKSEERAATMTDFVEGRLDVLVATTVIEVGVNVPNATVMVVLDSGRFGIAQLHQLRGRVGRGKHASECVLVGRVVSPEGRQRMMALCDSTDGFYLSEVDLKLRGHGSLLGTSQSGVSDLRVADIDSDVDLLETARKYATKLMSSDPDLARRPRLRSEISATLGSDAMAWLSRN